MTQIESKASSPSALFSRRNLILIAIALLTIAGGYLVLMSGSASAAAVLLVVGYCILFPMALVL